MRQFDNHEREFIKLIGKIELESNDTFPKFLQDNYFTIESQTALIVVHELKRVYYYMSPEVFDNVKLRASQLKKFWSVIGLINYLDENRHINVIPVIENQNMQLMCERFDNTHRTENEKMILNNNGDYLFIKDPTIIRDKHHTIILKGLCWNVLYEHITKKVMGIIFPTESISYLIKNNFQSEEDYRFNKLYRQTWISIIISFLLGLFSVIYSIFNSSSQFKLNEKLNSTFEIINQNNIKNETILLELDSIKNRIQSDTINKTGKKTL